MAFVCIAIIQRLIPNFLLAFLKMNLLLFLQKNDYKIALYLLISMHIAGFIGLQWIVTRPYFEALVAFNLIAGLGILLYFHTDWNKSFLIYFVLAYLIGFFIEYAGVKTKIIFGEYWYETALGFKILDIPLLIGVNWFVLSYCVGVIGNQLFKYFWFRIFFGAFLMTLLDYLIEPVAMRHHFWNWKNGIIPLQNYIAWFVVSSFLLYFFHYLRFVKSNAIAVAIFIVQFLFFLFHNLFYLFLA